MMQIIVHGLPGLTCTDEEAAVEEKMFVIDMVNKDDSVAVCDDDGAGAASAVHKLVYVVLKASTEEGDDSAPSAVSLSARESLSSMASEVPLTVAQMWLERFSRVNGGASPAEYAARERVVLLRILERIIGAIMGAMSGLDDAVAAKACTGRLVAMAVEEMTKQADLVREVQEPCSAVLVAMGGWHIDRVTDALMLKFQPSHVPHVFTVSTLDGLARAHPTESLPYLKQVLETMVANIRLVKKDALKAAYASACCGVCCALLSYLSGEDKSPDSSLTREHFHAEMDFLQEYLSSNWMSSRNPKVKNNVLDALSRMTWLVSRERLLRCACTMATALVAALKRAPDPFHVTSCLSQVLDAANGADPFVLEPVVETLMNAFVRQISKEIANRSAVEAANDPVERSRTVLEIFTCCSILARTFQEKLVNFHIAKMGGNDEALRHASLLVTLHLLSKSYKEVEERVEDIFKAVHGIVLQEEKFEVKKVLSEITAVFASRGLLREKEGKDFLDFVVRLCAAKGRDSGLREEGGRLLRRLTTEFPVVQPLLWPHMMEYLVLPARTPAVPAVLRCLNEIIARKSGDGSSVRVDFGQLSHVGGPCDVLARMLVLAAVPSPGARGIHVLAFLLCFARQINRHVPPLWSKRIPLLQLYLKNHLRSPAGAGVAEDRKGNADGEPVLTPSWQQGQWELWLMELLDDTVREIGLEEWNGALVSSLQQQLSLYRSADEDNDRGQETQEKCFLIKCLGLVLKNSSSRNLVSANLTTLEKVASSSVPSHDGVFSSCALAFGLCAVSYFDLVVEKLEEVTAEQQKRRGGFFRILSDANKPPGEQQIRSQKFVLLCLSRVVEHGPKDEITSRIGDMVAKFVLVPLRGGVATLHVAALNALSVVVGVGINAEKKKRRRKEGSTPTGIDRHHDELMRRTIECLVGVKGASGWTIGEKRAALSAGLALVKCHPKVDSETRRSLLKASITSILPHLTDEEEVKDEDVSAKADAMELMLTLSEEIIKQDSGQDVFEETFALLEPLTEQASPHVREVALTILQATLMAILSQARKDSGKVEFSPDSNTVGRLVIRCFDRSRMVQELAVKTLAIMMQVVDMVDKKGSEEGVQSSLVLSDFEEEKSESAAATDIAKVLAGWAMEVNLVPLASRLSDGLGDVASSSRGTSVVLRELLRLRRSELQEEAAFLTGVLLARLVTLRPSSRHREAKVEVLSAVRILFSLSPAQVTRHLLTLPVFGLGVAQERELSRVWDVVAAAAAKEKERERDLPVRVMNLLLENIRRRRLYGETCRGEDSVVRVPEHGPLSALSALRRLLRRADRETKAACEEMEFASTFAALVSCACSYFGIREAATNRGGGGRGASDAALDLPPGQEGCASGTETENDGTDDDEDGHAFAIAKGALHRFLVCRSCPLVSKVAEDFPSRINGEGELNALCGMACDLHGAVVNFYPHFLTGLAESLESQLTEPLFGRRLTSVAFFRQLLCSRSLAVDRQLKQGARCNLLAVLKWERESRDIIDVDDVGDRKASRAQVELRRKESDAIRILCLQGLSEMGEEESAAGKKSKGNDGSNGDGTLMPSVISAFVASINVEDVCGDVNVVAIRGLYKVLLLASRDEIVCYLPEIASRVRPFIDRPPESAAAVACFSQLAAFANVGGDACSAGAAFSFARHSHEALASLLLHAESEDADVRFCSRRGLAQIVEAIIPPDERVGHNVEAIMAHFADGGDGDGHGEEERALDYDRVVGDMSQFPELSSMFPAYLSSSVDHFRTPRSRERSCAVRLASSLVCRLSPSAVAEVDADSVCGGLAALLALDSDDGVRAAAAAAVGAAFVRLRRSISDGGGGGCGDSSSRGEEPEENCL